MKTKLVAGILVLAVVATSIGVVTARGYFGASASAQASMAEGGWSGGPCGMGQLTEEEREEMQEQMQEMHQQMQEYRQELCAQYNLTCPMGPQFVDEDGDGICDRKGDFGQGFQRGHGFGWFAETPIPEE